MSGGDDFGHPARIYGPRAGAGGRSVRFEVFAERIAARDAAGESFALPATGVRIERSGAGVSLEAPDRSFALVVTDPAGLASLREDAPVDLRDGIAAALGAVRRARGRDRRWLVAGVLALALLAWGGYIALLAAARAAVDELPIEFDVEVGEMVGDEPLPGVTALADPDVEAALAEIVGRLAPHAAVDGFEYRITLLDSPEVNAFALPGGRIFVLSGLVRAAESPEQVAGVLAHEMAHVTLRHGVRSLAQSLGLLLAIDLVIGDAGALAAIAVDGTRFLVENGYSRALEAEADAEGVRLLRAARIDPHGLARFFELLAGLGGPEVPSWLASHPDLADRIALVERLAGEGGAAEVEPFTFDWETVRR